MPKNLVDFFTAISAPSTFRGLLIDQLRLLVNITQCVLVGLVLAHSLYVPLVNADKTLLPLLSQGVSIEALLASGLLRRCYY